MQRKSCNKALKGRKDHPVSPNSILYRVLQIIASRIAKRLRGDSTEQSPNSRQETRRR